MLKPKEKAHLFTQSMGKTLLNQFFDLSESIAARGLSKRASTFMGSKLNEGAAVCFWAASRGVALKKIIQKKTVPTAYY